MDTESSEQGRVQLAGDSKSGFWGDVIVPCLDCGGGHVTLYNG